MLKERSFLYSIKLQSEAAHADGKASASYPEDPAELMNEGGQSFSVKMTQSSPEEDAIQDFYGQREINAWPQGFKGQVTLLLGPKAAGDFK